MRWDIIVPLAVYLVLLIGIAVWAFNQRQAVGTGGKSAEYYIAGRGLGWFILVFTLLASAASAGTYIGGPGLGYEWGYGWVLAAMAQVPAVLLVLGVLGKKFAIVARKLDALTVTDFLQLLADTCVKIERSWFFSGETALGPLGANWRAEYAVYLLSR